MARIDSENLDDVDRQVRIKELKKRAEELSGTNMTWESKEIPPEVQEAFWQHVVGFEQAPHTTLFQQLLDSSVELPDPENMNDRELTDKLWEVVDSLARMRTFIESTDHLSDRELYTELWVELLHQDTVLLKDELTSRRIDLIGSGSEEHTYLWLKYYADDETRALWMKEYPEYEMPSHEDPPYRRDHRLPRP